METSQPGFPRRGRVRGGMGMATLLPNVVVGVGVCVCVYGGVAGALRDETPLITKRRAEGFGRGTPTNLSTDPPPRPPTKFVPLGKGGSSQPGPLRPSCQLSPGPGGRAAGPAECAGSWRRHAQAAALEPERAASLHPRQLSSSAARPRAVPPRASPPLPSPSLGSPRLQLSQRTLSPSALWSLPDKPRVRST